MIIKPGKPVEVRRGDGTWLSCVAVSEVQGIYAAEIVNTGPGQSYVRKVRKIHDFPTVWVRFPDGPDGRINAMPWPATHVRPRQVAEHSEKGTTMDDFTAEEEAAHEGFMSNPIAVAYARGHSAGLRNQTPSAAALVREFHEAFGGQIFERTDAVRELRARLTREEAREAAEAILSGDLAATAKELADQVVIAYGTALALGIDLDAAVRAVHASNMTKLTGEGPLMRPDGKVLKGPNYQRPDLSGCILDEPS